MLPIVNLCLANPIGWLTLRGRNPSVDHRQFLANFFGVRPTQTISTSTTTRLQTGLESGQSHKEIHSKQLHGKYTHRSGFLFRGGGLVVWSNTLVLGTSAKELLMLIPNEAEEATRRLQTSFFPAQNELPAKITICGHFFFRHLAFGELNESVPMRLEYRQRWSWSYAHLEA